MTGPKPIRLADIASDVGVSLMTVSRILNNRGQYSAEMTRKVQEAAQRLGYRPNLAARQLTGRRSSTIGLVVPYLSDLFFKHCVYAIQETAREKGFGVLALAHNRDLKEEREAVSLMLQRQVAGLLVASAGGHHPHFDELRRRNVPLVAFDVPVENTKSDAVLVDNAESTASAILHLLAHGHRHIAFLGTEMATYTMRIRRESYTKTMREAGFAPMLAVSEGPLSGEEMDTLFRKALSGTKRPTAVFTVNSHATVRVLLLLEKLSLSVPRDVAIIGFDDFEFAAFLKPQLTAVRQPAEELGSRAMQRLIDRLNGDVSAPFTEVLKAELIVRESCGCGAISEALASNHSRPARRIASR